MKTCLPPTHLAGYKRNVRQTSASPALAGSANPYGSRSPEARRGRSRTRSGSRSPARRGSDSRSPGRRGSRSRSPDGRDRQRPYYHPRPNYNNRGGYNNYRGGYNNYRGGYNKVGQNDKTLDLKKLRLFFDDFPQLELAKP